jgi:hypothetical protein
MFRTQINGNEIFIHTLGFSSHVISTQRLQLESIISERDLDRMTYTAVYIKQLACAYQYRGHVNLMKWPQLFAQYNLI